MALSRATSLDGLQVLNFDVKKVRVFTFMAPPSLILTSLLGDGPSKGDRMEQVIADYRELDFVVNPLFVNSCALPLFPT